MSNIDNKVKLWKLINEDDNIDRWVYAADQLLSKTEFVTFVADDINELLELINKGHKPAIGDTSEYEDYDEAYTLLGEFESFDQLSETAHLTLPEYFI